MMLCLLCSHIIFCCMSIQNNTQYSGEDFYVNVAAGKNFFFKSHFRFLKKKMFLIFAFTLCHRSPFRWTLQQNPSMYYWSKCNSQNLHNFGASFQEFLKQPSKRFSYKTLCTMRCMYVYMWPWFYNWIIRATSFGISGVLLLACFLAE